MNLQVSVLDQVFAAILQQVLGVVSTFVPVGQGVTASLVTLAVLFCGVNVATGGSYLAPLIRLAGAAAGTYWAISYWGEIVQGTLEAADRATAMLIPGYHGTAALFTMAIDVAGRIELEKLALTWTAVWSSIGAVVVGAFVPLFVVIGLGFIAVLAVTAKLTLLLGAAVAPLVLPALAFGLTASLGWGVIQFILTSAVRVIVMGALSHIFANAITAVIELPGSINWLQNEEIFILALIALMCIVAGLSANTIANQLVGGALGSLGMASVQRGMGYAVQAASLPVSAAASAGSAAARMTGGAAAAAGGARGGSGGGGAGAQSGLGAGSVNASAAVPQSSGSGKVFA